MATVNGSPGEKLKHLIKENGYTQEQFGQLTGIGLTQLKECLSGKKDLTSLSYETLTRISKKLDVQIGYILGDFSFRNNRSNDIYTYLKSLKGFEVECNPDNEDQIFLKHGQFEMYTDIKTIDNKIIESLLFLLFLENNR